MSRKGQLLAACLVLFAINVLICSPLFRIEYLDTLGSNEGYFIVLGKQLRESWPHWTWSPTFNAGLPFENAYLPLVPILVALGSFLTSPARAFYLITAATYSLAPVFLFLFADRLSGRRRASFAAGLLWSIASPALLIPALFTDMGSPLGLRRLYNIVRWGEAPHNFALSLLPLALFLIQCLLEKQSPRRFALAAFACALVMLANPFGMLILPLGVAVLVAIQDGLRPRTGVIAALALLSAYLLISRLAPPSLLQLIRANSLTIGGDYRFSAGTAVGAGFLLLLILLWIATRKLKSPALRFSVLFASAFGSITVLHYGFHTGFLPQPNRYHLEMELGVCLVLAFGFDALVRIPKRAVNAVAVLGFFAVAGLSWMDARAARVWIRPAGVRLAGAQEQARWIDAHLPGQRVFIGGEEQWWFSLFARNPQFGAGFEPSTPNWMQRVANYTIYSGHDAGPQDGPISAFWLKAFGCGAIEVPGPSSRDYFHAIANPAKFEGLLPLLWTKDGNSIYQVPLRSPSLAHIIPKSAIVTRRPIHGLDIDPVRAYVAALDDAALPPATLSWLNAETGQIRANIAPGQAVSVQVNYDPGWQATVHGAAQPLRPDELGLLLIEPACTGDCTIDLTFTGGLERRICSILSIATGLILLAMLFFGRAPKYLQMID